MNKRTKASLRLFAVLLACVGALRASPPPPENVKHPHDMEKITVQENVTLELRIPYRKILFGEIPHVYLGIHNNGTEPLLIGDDFWSYPSEQLLYEARASGRKENLTRPDFIPTWERFKEKRDQFAYFQPIEKDNYRVYTTQGGAITSLGWLYDITPPGTQKIRVSLLTGENEWAFSDWVPIQRLHERRLHDCETVATIFKGTGRERMIKRAVIDGETYLFLVNRSNGTRIARVPEGAKPRFEVFTRVVEGMTERTLVIHFDGTDIPPVVHMIHNIVTMEGTAETAPHLEVLKDLEKTMSGLDSGQKSRADTKAATGRGPKPATPPGGPQEEETENTFWSWLAAALVLVLAALLYLAKKRRNAQ